MGAISLKYKSKSGNLTAPGDVDPGAMIPIATVTVGAGGQSSISFTSIPQGYEHLQIRALAKGNRSIVIENAFLTFNSDTTSTNYRDHAIYADGTVIAGASQNNGIIIYTFAGSGGTTGSSVFGSNIIDILDYANTNKNKTVRYLGGYENNSAGLVAFGSGVWLSTNAVNSITLVPTVGTLWLQNSSFALYGIKRAGA